MFLQICYRLRGHVAVMSSPTTAVTSDVLRLPHPSNHHGADQFPNGRAVTPSQLNGGMYRLRALVLCDQRTKHARTRAYRALSLIVNVLIITNVLTIFAHNEIIFFILKKF